ncbi:MAG TPA: DUF4399 domain-containing protein [Gammaproteobacteria bacterium]|nr:DUF4399 domain-containing protein [Gammaproteobacteria bacterium]
MLKWVLIFAAVCALTTARAADAPTAPTAAPATPAATAYIISPADGAEVTSPFVVQFGLKGMGIAPAGVEFANTGHHHLLIDVAELPPKGKPIPADETHRHFGKGQTETELSLPPGRHTLQLLLGDHLHIPQDPPVTSAKITITVK